MKKFCQGGLLFLIVVFIFWGVEYGNKSSAQFVQLESKSVEKNVVELLQHKSINEEDDPFIYYVEYMLQECGVDKKWIRQLSIHEKEPFVDAEDVHYYQINIDENREICIIAARFSIQKNVYRYHMVVCINSSLMDQSEQNSQLWLCFPDDSQNIVFNKDVVQISQWFAGERIRGKIFYDTAQEQVNSPMQKFYFKNQDYDKEGMDQCVYYIALEFVCNMNNAGNEAGIPFTVYFQPNMPNTVSGECSNREVPKLNELNITQDGLDGNVKEGWIGVGNIPVA